jgi:rhodanese-related sulfurtransferase
MLGLTRIPLHHYVLASLVCMAPGTVAYTWLGHAGRGALSGEADAVRYGLLALALLAVIAMLPRLLRRMRGPLTWIETGELRRRLEGGEVVTVIDVRSPEEFIGPLGHIPASRNIPIAGLASQIGELAGLEQAPLVLVCRTERRSATAARILREAGFVQATVLRGGMVQWNEHGFAVDGRAETATT